MSETVKVRAAAAALVVAVVAAFGLTAGFYTHAFSDDARITVDTARAGLVMSPGNKVKMRGVEVGRVDEVRGTADGAELVLAVDPAALSRIPANVDVRISASTVFGAKFVDLAAPSSPSTTTLAAGAVLDATAVTTEVNTVFESLGTLLDGIDVPDLNSTLTVLASTLDGRGDDIAAIAAQAEAYLTRLEPLLPQLRRDLDALVEVADLGTRITPSLMQVLDNAASSSETITSEQAALDRLLVSLTLLGQQGAEVLGVNGEALTRLLASLRPTTATLRTYSGELPCLLVGLDRTREVMADAIGGTDAGLRALLTIRSELPAYAAPGDLPGALVTENGGCAGLPVLGEAQLPTPQRGGAR
ncbi:MCE family protein [Nocardioides zeae]|uniref:MCE family protein n=1 Tax=Nocardioides zeae TaxID=1457234 RepID=A0A6P0HFX2_9ACTN|nr:MCE family protein [Nocardioides zeae]NEN77599.1 MCE family protein [Nocardioides zeae]